MLRRLALLLALVCAGCTGFKNVGTPEFAAQAAQLLPPNTNSAQAVTGKIRYPGTHLAITGQFAPNIYEQMYSISDIALYTYQFERSPKYLPIPFESIISAEISTGRFSWPGSIALIVGMPGGGQYNSYLMVTDDGVKGTTHQEKTMAFFNRLETARQAFALRPKRS